MNSNFQFSYKFTNPLRKILYINYLDRLAFFEKGTDTIILMHPESGTINSK